MKTLLASLFIFFSGLILHNTNQSEKIAIIPTPTPINCEQVRSNKDERKLTANEIYLGYDNCFLTPTPSLDTESSVTSYPNPTLVPNSNLDSESNPENSNSQPSPIPTESGLQGHVQLHSDYAGGLVGQDSNGNQVHLHPDYTGGYQGYDSNGNQIKLHPDYAGGLNMNNGSNTQQHCNYNYVNGYNCN